jgi:hypothetical protein
MQWIVVVLGLPLIYAAPFALVWLARRLERPRRNRPTAPSNTVWRPDAKRVRRIQRRLERIRSGIRTP